MSQHFTCHSILQHVTAFYNMSQHFTTFYNILQHLAICHSILQHVTAFYNMSQHFRTCHWILQDITTCYNIMAHMSQHSTTCHSILQPVTAFYNMSQHFTTCHSILQHFTTFYNILQHFTTFGHMSQHFTTCHSILQHVTAFYNILQHVTAFYNILQHLAICAVPTDLTPLVDVDSIQQAQPSKEWSQVTSRHTFLSLCYTTHTLHIAWPAVYQCRSYDQYVLYQYISWFSWNHQRNSHEQPICLWQQDDTIPVPALPVSTSSRSLPEDNSVVTWPKSFKSWWVPSRNFHVFGWKISLVSSMSLDAWKRYLCSYLL